MPRLSLVLLALCLLGLALASPPPLLLSNINTLGGNCTLGWVDPFTGSAVKTVGPLPQVCAAQLNTGFSFSAFSERGRVLYVATSGGKSVSRVQVDTGRTLPEVPLPAAAAQHLLGMEIDPASLDLFLLTPVALYRLPLAGPPSLVANVSANALGATAYDPVRRVFYFGEGGSEPVLAAVEVESGKVVQSRLSVALPLCLALQYSQRQAALLWLSGLDIYSIPLPSPAAPGTPKPVASIPNSDGYVTKHAFDEESQTLILSAFFNMFVVDTTAGKLLAQSSFDGYHSLGYVLPELLQ